MENNNLLQMQVATSAQAKEEWSKPEIKIIDVRQDTLGNTSTGPDCGAMSGSVCT